MDLFKRFPKLRLKLDQEQHIIPEEEQGKYSALQADFVFLEDALMPAFRKLDTEALKCQNAHRGMYVILIFGGTLATLLGIIQLVFVNVDGIGITGAIVAAFLGGVTLALRSFQYQQRYMHARLAAEQLRGEYFLFLGHMEPYDGPDRASNLRQRVIDITSQEENAL